MDSLTIQTFDCTHIVKLILIRDSPTVINQAKDFTSVTTNTDLSPLTILVVDDEPNIRKTMSMCLEMDGHRVHVSPDSQSALDIVDRIRFDLAFVDLRLGTENGLDLVVAMLRVSPWTKIVVITAYASIETAVDAMKRGATDYLPKPFTPDQIRAVTNRIAHTTSLESQVATLRESLRQTQGEIDFQSASPAMERAIHMARQVATSDINVLLRGESGTGKTALAAALHAWSPRARRPFSTVSCPSLSSELLESELFGHVRGAFTGALRENPGRIAACDGGTLLLDEVGDLPQSVQARLLRFLQDKTYERVGDHVTRKADVRILAATNANLSDLVSSGKFREDLFYRLNVVEIVLPPLRERKQDIPALTQRLLHFFAATHHKGLLATTEELDTAFLNYSWPGNVRELRNVLERAIILCAGATIGIELLPESLQAGSRSIQIGDDISLAQIEELHIRRVLSSTASLQEAADILGIDQATLWRRRKQYGI